MIPQRIRQRPDSEEKLRMTTAEKLLLTIPQACETTGYSRSFLYDRIYKERLKVVRVGRTIRISMDDLKDWIAEQRGP